MTRQLPETVLRAIRIEILASIVGVSAGLLLMPSAEAQQRVLGSTNGVVIDLSVLDGDAGDRRPITIDDQPAKAAGKGFTLFAPEQKPVSRLEGPLANRPIALTSPTAQPVSPPVTVVPMPVRTPAPKAATAPAVTKAPTTPPAPEAGKLSVPAAPTAALAIETPPPPPTQTAAPPPATADDGDEIRILFDQGSANLNDQAKADLDSLAKQLASDISVRLQLQAYAAGTDETAPDARRLSLSRALKVRSHLIEQGVRSTRMDVRALGVKAGGGPADRVDAVIVRR